MSNKFLYLITCSLFTMTLACSTANTTNENVNAVSNVNIPPEFSASPVPMSSLPPGIPDPNSNVNSVPKGTTPIPGIPDSKNLGKPFQKGPTPIPGISDSVIKNNSLSNSNANSKNERKSSPLQSNSMNNSVNRPPTVPKP